jgi:hypothetical protein
MAAPRILMAYSMAFLVATCGARAAAQTGKGDPLGKAAIRVTGLGKAPDSKRGTPQGKLMAERAAELVAKRNLALAIGQVSVEGTDRDREIFVSKFVRGAHITSKKVNEDGSVEVTMELPLSEVARNFAEMQRLAIRAEENRQKLEEVFKKSEDDLRTMRTRLDTVQESMKKIEAELQALDAP